MTDASTLAGENVFGSFSNEITLSRIVLNLQSSTYTSLKQTRVCKSIFIINLR
uniref:Uncharacterized protein n=1 Tax=Arion vulgaris TaxID=1028688 RepID=A0A0B7AZI7_9EUPU